jgi:hypothetical protein
VLLSHPKNTEDVSTHGSKVEAFPSACRALDPKTFLEGALAYPELNRDKARELNVIEFDATMAREDKPIDPGYSSIRRPACRLPSSWRRDNTYCWLVWIGTRNVAALG